MDYQIAENLVNLLGGVENIKYVENCMTRCRVELLDYSIVDIEKIKSSESVLGIVEADNQLQIIYGPGKVRKVTEEVKKIIGISNKTLIGDEAVKRIKQKLKQKNDTKFKNILKKTVSWQIITGSLTELLWEKKLYYFIFRTKEFLIPDNILQKFFSLCAQKKYRSQSP